MARYLMTLLPLALLAGCDDGDKGTSVTFASNDSGEQVTASANGDTGRVAIDAPGFKADIKLPKIELDSDNLDIEGVKLYPGSTVGSVDIAGGDSGDGDDSVRIRFAAPGDARAVRDWFDQRMRAEGFTVTGSAAGLSGTTGEGKAFRLDLAPAGTGTNGTFTVGR